MKRAIAIVLSFVMVLSCNTACAVESKAVVGDFSEERAWMKKSDLYGYIDKYGNWVVEPAFDYEYAGDFSDGYAVLETDGRCVIIDISGNVVCSLDTYSGQPVKEGLAVSSTGKYTEAFSTYVAVNDEAIVPNPPAGKQFLRANSFSDGLAFVEIGIPSVKSAQRDGCAFIDHQGNVQIALDDDLFYLPNGSFKWYDVNSSGFKDGYAVLDTLSYSWGESFLDGQIVSYVSVIIDEQGNKCFMLKTEDKHTIYNCGNGMFCVAVGRYVRYSGYTVDYYYYIDAHGNDLTNERYSELPGSMDSVQDRHLVREGTILVGIDRKGTVAPCYIDTTGTVIISNQGWTDARGFSEGLAAVCKDGKWGYINVSGEYVIEPQYDAARDYSCGVAIVDCGGEWFIIDAQGNVLY